MLNEDLQKQIDERVENARYKVPTEKKQSRTEHYQSILMWIIAVMIIGGMLIGLLRSLIPQ